MFWFPWQRLMSRAQLDLPSYVGRESKAFRDCSAALPPNTSGPGVPPEFGGKSFPTGPVWLGGGREPQRPRTGKPLTRKVSWARGLEILLGNESKRRIWGQLPDEETKFSMLADGSLLLGHRSPRPASIQLPDLPCPPLSSPPRLHSALCRALLCSPRLPTVCGLAAWATAPSVVVTESGLRDNQNKNHAP